MNGRFSWGENENMQPFADIPHCYISELTIITAPVLPYQRRRPIELVSQLKGQPTPQRIAETLALIIRNIHVLCIYNNCT